MAVAGAYRRRDQLANCAQSRAPTRSPRLPQTLAEPEDTRRGEIPHVDDCVRVVAGLDKLFVQRMRRTDSAAVAPDHHLLRAHPRDVAMSCSLHHRLHVDIEPYQV